MHAMRYVLNVCARCAWTDELKSQNRKKLIMRLFPEVVCWLQGRLRDISRKLNVDSVVEYGRPPERWGTGLTTQTFGEKWGGGRQFVRIRSSTEGRITVPPDPPSEEGLR
ncbi:hypothetical protein VTK26DRAFT_1762 [Humicola hyalothermophila]